MQPDLQNLPLRDIHIPDAVSWWPLAPGWWLLLLLILLAAIAVMALRRFQQRRRLRKTALIAFNTLKANYYQNHDAQQLLRSLSMLLRRISISQLPRTQTAALTGEAWLQCLDKLTSAKALPKEVFSKGVGRVLADAPYRKNADINAEVLLNLCETWIKTLPLSTPPIETIPINQPVKTA